MQAPYDRERGQAPDGGDPSGWPEHAADQSGYQPYAEPPHAGYDPQAGYPPQQPYGQQPAPPHGQRQPAGYDPYLADSYAHDPYAARDPLAQDPVGEALYDRTAHPPYQGPTDPAAGYQQPQAPQHYQDPRWGAPEAQYPQQAQPGASYPDGLAGQHGDQFGGPYQQHGQHGQHNQYNQHAQQHGPGPTGGYPPAGSDQQYQQQPGQPDDAFAYLFRDQQHPGAGPAQSPAQPPAESYPQPHHPQGQHPYPQQHREQPREQQHPQYQHPQHPQHPQHQQHRPPAPPPPSPPAPAAAPAPAADPTPTPAESKGGGGRASSLLRSSAIMAAGTLVSRVTGFVRQLVIVAALGAAVLADTYTVAWALPSMIYFLIIGGGLNSVFVPQLVRAMKDDEDGGDAYANRLLTLVMVALAVLVVGGMLAAPLLVRLQTAKFASDPAANELTITFARYFLPTIFFTGVYTVLGQILNARDRFGAMMWTPVLNNIVVIFTFGMFLWVYGTQGSSEMNVTTITPEGIRLLGIGTLLGLVVQAGAMLPYLRAAGFRIRPRFDWRGHGLGKAARLAKWTVLFVLANQAALIVVTQFATWAGDNADRAGFPGTGFTAYNSTLLIWQMPQAIITVSVMAALLPRLSRSAADNDTAAVRDDLSHGLRTSAVAIVPISFAFLALGIPICTMLFGSAGEASARSFGYILMAFGLGLIPYSAQYVVLRAFYAYEDTKTPFFNTVVVSFAWIVLSTLSFVLLPDRWVVAGIAFGYGVAYALGVVIAWRRLRQRMRTDLDGPRVVRTYIRLCGACLPAALLGGLAGLFLLDTLGQGLLGSLAAVSVGGLLLLAIFYLAARRMRIQEMTVLVGMVRSRLGR
ncbi:murein biosynthesis integral membrane protein MurJ [Streptomyces sp. DSM 44915]|uniref:Murein biosynthesis integral membrane protein MurJ n=1 Tax=Streptomyces chisholmiae TaxID=3075540 RepID=A0ABU2JSA1_9ACTN|nr:murein biosynthesis integral membrane protein MurJ [Streptomyces sp. DSM 44915]MDT0267098.1 murein biosynthesis integral membrane protein MurJ [Streptomyces sp. DSM 44915]